MPSFTKRWIAPKYHLSTDVSGLPQYDNYILVFPSPYCGWILYHVYTQYFTVVLCPWLMSFYLIDYIARDFIQNLFKFACWCAGLSVAALKTTLMNMFLFTWLLVFQANLHSLDFQRAATKHYNPAAASVDERRDLALFDKAFHAADLWPHIYQRQRSRSSNQIISANLPWNKIYISFFTMCLRALQSLSWTWNDASAGCNLSKGKKIFEVTNPRLLFLIMDWKATLLRCKRAPPPPPQTLKWIIISQIVVWTCSFWTELTRCLAVCRGLFWRVAFQEVTTRKVSDI